MSFHIRTLYPTLCAFFLLLSGAIAQQPRWQESLTSIPDTVTAIAADPNGRVCVGTQDSGIYVSSDYGLHFARPATPIPNLHILSLALNPIDKIMVGTAKGLYVNGFLAEDSSWSEGPWFAAYETQKIVALTRAHDRTIYAAGGDRGAYSIEHSDTTGWLFTPTYFGRYAWALTTLPSGEVFAATPDAGIFRSTDNSHWSQLPLKAPGLLSLIGTRKGHLFASGSNIYRSTDNGEHWDTLASATIVPALAESANGSIYAATDLGVMVSTDDGLNWDLAAPGLPEELIVSLTAATDGSIYASTFTGRVFRLKENQPSAVTALPGPIPFSFTTFPNPATEQILVSLTLASPEDVRIELADVTGRHATTVTAGRLTDGPHDFRIEASALPAGIYFCSITAGDDHVARKVVVMH